MEREHMSGSGSKTDAHDKDLRAGGTDETVGVPPHVSKAGDRKYDDFQRLDRAARDARRDTGTVVTEHIFQGRGVRSIMKDGDTWFVAADVCAVLEHSDPSKAVSRLDDDERGANIVRTPGGEQLLNVVNESGLYALIFSSRKPQAKAFRRWVTSEVLPTIRRTGDYAVAGDAADTVTLSLREPARYVVMVAPGRPPHVRRTRYDAILAEKTALDCEILCHALKSIECWWYKTEQLRSAGCNPTGGFAIDRLEHAVLDGGILAEQFLRSRQEERS